MERIYVYLISLLPIDITRMVHVEDITVDDVEEYMYYLVDKRELAPRSRNRYLFSLRSFFNYTKKKGVIEKNVAAEFESSIYRQFFLTPYI